MADLYAKCPDCGTIWLAAKLPMDVRQFARQAIATHCKNGCDDVPVMASEQDFLAWTAANSKESRT